MTELLAALDALVDTHLIFTMPNADTDGRVLFDMINRFVGDHPNARAYTSLGQLRYLSCLRHVDGVVGNSSSGLAEAPSFPKGTVNIGDRQKGRLRAESVIDCAPERESISAAIAGLYLPAFRSALAAVRSPYGEGGASERVVEVVAKVPLGNILKKSFFNLPGP
jgi:GDP/UDP-N,N'-diacetylbacillosamine 2-epimerase (hydrolysing)